MGKTTLMENIFRPFVLAQVAGAPLRAASSDTGDGTAAPEDEGRPSPPPPSSPRGQASPPPATSCAADASGSDDPDAGAAGRAPPRLHLTERVVEAAGSRGHQHFRFRVLEARHFGGRRCEVRALCRFVESGNAARLEQEQGEWGWTGGQPGCASACQRPAAPTLCPPPPVVRPPPVRSTPARAPAGRAARPAHRRLPIPAAARRCQKRGGRACGPHAEQAPASGAGAGPRGHAVANGMHRGAGCRAPLSGPLTLTSALPLRARAASA